VRDRAQSGQAPGRGAWRVAVREVHLYFYGISADDVAEALRQASSGAGPPASPGRACYDAFAPAATTTPPVDPSIAR